MPSQALKDITYLTRIFNMINKKLYYNVLSSPLGELILTSYGTKLNGLHFSSNEYLNFCKKSCVKNELPIFKKTKQWLDIYFRGEKPTFNIEIEFLENVSEFQKQVWNELLKIPYGKTTTYGEIAKILQKLRNVNKMSSQAVGGAIGKNNIAIIVPCHRVIGKNNKLVGYAGGLDKKVKLLQLEGIKLKCIKKLV